MREYRIGQAAGLLGVSPDTLRRWADSGRLKTKRTKGGHRVVVGTELAKLAAKLRATPEEGTSSLHSARNRLTGIVT
jgi:excisionase family DNA binding protein